MAQHLREVIGSNGAKVLFNTRVEKLIVEDGKVTGVEAVDGNTGTKYTIRAKKTLLTTGGYGNNKNLLTDTYKNTLYYGPVSSTGDGLQMAQKLGVKTAIRTALKLRRARPSPPSTPMSARSTRPASS